MAIKVRLESKDVRDAWGGIVEDCWFCKNPTRYWTTNGMIPVCRACAKKHKPSEVPTRAQYVATWERRR